jgi:hypothetical protein
VTRSGSAGETGFYQKLVKPSCFFGLKLNFRICANKKSVRPACRLVFGLMMVVLIEISKFDELKPDSQPV